MSGLPRGGAFRDFARPGTTTFFLTAPFKPAVHLVGDFNGWDPRPRLCSTTAAATFWLPFPSRARLATSLLVTMDGLGRAGVCRRPVCPRDRLGRIGPKAVLADDAALSWHDLSWQRPPLRDLVIYELCVRDFGAPGRHSAPGDWLSATIGPLCRRACQARPPAAPRGQRHRADAGQRVPRR